MFRSWLSGFLFLLAIIVSSNDAILCFAQVNITTGQSNISSSNTGANVFTGININQFVGAEKFYNAGYDGAGAIVGNIEAGHAYQSHETLNHVTTRVTGTGALGTDDSHATRVTQAMSGRLSAGGYPASYHAFGIAKGAETWSGAIATAFGGGGSFSVTNASLASVYSSMIKTGVGGQTVNVFNSSWGYTGSTGFNTFAVGVDGLLNDTGVVGVASTGNSGPGGNTVGGIAAGYNSIGVGALGPDTSTYSTVSSFSSRGPNNFFHVGLNQTIVGVRSEVDIVAPGQSLTLAAINTTNGYTSNNAGTSFSAPIVAGGAGLIVGAGKDIYSTNALAIDGRIVKSVLMNSASKLPGWNNGQSVVAGVIQTTQSVDYSMGAGAMDLNQAFDQYVSVAEGGLAETMDVVGQASGDLGNVGTVGWDFGNVLDADSNLYFLDKMLLANSKLSVTITWFADMISGSDANFSGAGANHLANLDLRIFRFDNLLNRNILGTYAQSISLYNVAEHLYLDIDSTGFYGIEVVHTQKHWDFGASEAGEQYGLAWSGVGLNAVPEPGHMILLGMGAVGGFVRFRRRRRLNDSIANGTELAA
jgi:PEP-CTERM motif